MCCACCTSKHAVVYSACGVLMGTCLQERRTQLFSATMTTKVAKLQRACLMDPVKVEVAQKYSTVDTLRQQYLFVPAKYKVCSRSSTVSKDLPGRRVLLFAESKMWAIVWMT